MALTLRRNKSLPLTHDELDDNFEYLSSSIATGGSTNLTVSGSFTPERVIISGNTSSAAPGGLATSNNLRVWVDNNGFAIGGSQGSNGVNGVGFVISEDPSNGNHVILSDGSGSNLNIRAGGSDAGDSYINILTDQAGSSLSDIFTIAKFGGPLRGTELYHTGSLVLHTAEIGANKAVVVTGTVSASAEVYFSGLANTTTPNIVGYDSTTGQLSYYSTASFGGGSTDYVSNVTLVGTDLTFTGTGNAFNSTVDLSTLGGGGSTDITALNNFTGSAQISINALNTGTGSYVYSGSFDGSTTLTLYSADTNYNLDLSALSGGGGSTDITALNNFTGSAQISLASLNAFSASMYSTSSQLMYSIDEGSAPWVIEWQWYDGSNGGFMTMTQTRDEFRTFSASAVTSGSYDSTSKVITLYSRNQNYSLDLSGLAGGGGGFPITASDEGSDLTNSMSKIDFVGNAVTATNVGSIVTVTINTGSAASATDITDLNNFTGSAQISINALNAATGSYLTGADTGSFVYSGSFDGSTTLTLYSADTNYSLDLSALAGGGTPTDITALNNFTGSAQISLDALNAATGSYYYSSSVSNATITFNQGDGTTEQVTIDNVVNAVSASYAPSLNIYTSDGELTNTRTVTLGGNELIFVADQGETFQISSDPASEVLITDLATGTYGQVIGYNTATGQLVAMNTSSIAGGGAAVDTGSFYYSSSIASSTITFFQGDGTTESVTVPAPATAPAQVNSSAVYAESGTPFNVYDIPSTFTVVNINSTNIEVAAPKTVTGDSDRLLAIATMEVGSANVGIQHCVFDYEIYNDTQASQVTGTSGKFTGYLLPYGEGAPTTTFTFTCPISTGVNVGDTLQLRVQPYNVSAYASSSLHYASLTLLDIE